MENKLQKFESFLSGKGSLESLFQSSNGYYDLRALKSNKQKDDLKSLGSNFNFIEKEVASVDFSYSDFARSEFKKCKFVDCIFDDVNMHSVVMFATSFENCTFKKTNFKGSFLLNRIHYDFGGFKSCMFEDCDFRSTMFDFPVIEDSIFKNCNFKSIDFNGSRFKNVKFIGKLDDVRFRGLGEDRNGWFIKTFYKIDPKKHQNKMENVDFSLAKLIYTVFSHSIDISKCIFPIDTSNYLLVKNHKQAFDHARQALNILNDKDKKLGLWLIDMLFYNENVRNQKIVFIDKVGPKETQKDEILDIIYNVIGKNEYLIP